MPRRDEEMNNLLDGVFPVQENVRQRRQYRMPIWLGIVLLVGAFALGVAWAPGYSQKYDSPPASGPIPTVTVYATETRKQPTLPASCGRALAMMETMMAYNSTIASAGEKQLDLSHAARRAMFSKDWAALDKTMVEQTELNNSLDTPSQRAMGKYAELAQTMKECRDDLK